MVDKMQKIVPNFPTISFSDMANAVKSFIKKNKCKELSADISLLNLVDASKTALLCSTYHFAKYPDGKISWEVADEETKQFINSMKLKNMNLAVKDVQEGAKESTKRGVFTAV